MKFYLDTEFNGFGGEIISLALVAENDYSLYLINPELTNTNAWVSQNVMPYLYDCPFEPDVKYLKSWPRAISNYFNFFGDEPPHIIADWPDDISYFCKSLITGPGLMMGPKLMTFEVNRVDSYPNDVVGAVRHNAWWDAKCLKEKLSC